MISSGLSSSGSLCITAALLTLAHAVEEAPPNVQRDLGVLVVRRRAQRCDIPGHGIEGPTFESVEQQRLLRGCRRWLRWHGRREDIVTWGGSNDPAAVKFALDGGLGAASRCAHRHRGNDLRD